MFLIGLGLFMFLGCSSIIVWLLHEDKKFKAEQVRIDTLYRKLNAQLVEQLYGVKK